MDPIAQHIEAAVAGSHVVAEPGPHMLISDLLPAAAYARLLGAIPPPEAFEVADRVKANFDPVRNADSSESARTWLWFHDDVVSAMITPRLIDAFRPYLAAAYQALFGPGLGDEAVGLQHRAFRGRLMLRRPGYRLKPHRDEKIAMLTGLVYFARPGDNRDYGTDLYRVHDDQEAAFMKTYYPEAHGGRAELAKSIPFVGNSSLVFMNVAGMAHGAGIPPDATQTERYAYQFYVGPRKSKLGRLVRRLPPERAAAWGDLGAPDDMG